LTNININKRNPNSDIITNEFGSGEKYDMTSHKWKMEADRGLLMFLKLILMKTELIMIP
jgi:frataxin-like iron-binding protein CyaY